MPEWHPIARDREAADQIDEEVASGPADQFGPVTLTRSWLLRPTTFGLVRLRLEDAVWVYGVQVGGRNCAIMKRRDGKMTVVQVKAKLLPALLQSIMRRVPWALTGYDKERDVLWRKRPAEVIAMADARRREYDAHGGQRG
jgi:hypothetical protein